MPLVITVSQTTIVTLSCILLDYQNFIVGVSAMAPSSVGNDTIINCQFSTDISSPNPTRQCRLCYSTLVNTITFSDCETKVVAQESDQPLSFQVQFPSSRGGSYGPFFYEMTAFEDDRVVAVVQGQVFTGKMQIYLKMTITLFWQY